MFEVAGLVERAGGQALCATGFPRKPFHGKNWIRIAGLPDHAFHALFSRVTGRHGCFSKRATKRLLKIIEDFSPDVIHLHNLHGWYINLPMLFSFLKQRGIPVVWTLHDCWSFTGQCPYFTVSGCEKWITGCGGCSSFREYPAAYVDATKRMWQRKKEWFIGVPNLTLVTPSHWLKGLVTQSFLKDYDCRVLPNGIDLAVFQPTESDFRRRHGLQDKFVVLSVAFGWDERKGLDIMIELAGLLPEQYQIVLVGTNARVDRQLPDTILSLHRTFDKTELAGLYTMADIFVNPTREDNYPTVNMEALACGTQVLTSGVGGSAEMIDDSCGSVVTELSAAAFAKEIRRLCEINPYAESACLAKAREFDQNNAYARYLQLFSELL